jgi:hypothetical protein
LNSHIYDAARHRFVSKPVLSFLLPDRSKPGSILGDVVRGISSFRWPVRLRIVNDVMRHEIALRGVLSDISVLGPRWRRELLKRRWFRCSALEGPAPVERRGTDRNVATKVGPPPHPKVYEFVSETAALLCRDRVDRWIGKKVRPLSERIDRKQWKTRTRLRTPRLKSIFTYGGVAWAFVWPAELLSFFESRFPSLLRSYKGSTWADDHPLLTTRPLIFETKSTHQPWMNPSFASSFCRDWPLGYS